MVKANSPPDTKPLPIAVVDDEPDILNLLELHLKKAGFPVATFPDATSFYRFLENCTPRLIILDLMLPDVDGVDVCRYLKSESRFATIPIIMLTARQEESDRVLGLELGADDYVTKPFSPRELVARVRAILRRQEQPPTKPVTTIAGVLTLDPHRHEVTVGGEKVNLTTTEFRILKILAEKPGWVFTREQLLNELWGNEKAVLDRTIDVHIRNLRAKLGKAGDLIRSIRGVGYKLEA